MSEEMKDQIREKIKSSFSEQQLGPRQKVENFIRDVLIGAEFVISMDTMKRLVDENGTNMTNEAFRGIWNEMVEEGYLIDSGHKSHEGYPLYRWGI